MGRRERDGYAALRRGDVVSYGFLGLRRNPKVIRNQERAVRQMKRGRK